MKALTSLICVSVLAATAGCASTDDTNRVATATSATATQAANADLQAAVNGAWRTPANTARDGARHPLQTLAFFGVEADHRVIEITPGRGWYTEILAPYLSSRGQYLAAIPDPQIVDTDGVDYQQKALERFEAFLASHPQQYGRTEVVKFDPGAPTFGAADSADVVLTFRNVHNWIGSGTAQGYFNGFFKVLKPGGVLGVIEHRAKPGTDAAVLKESGYMTEDSVIELATKAGFVLEERSDINANPRDDTDHPNGVWTLPPSNRHDPEDAASYRAIGESDRMTLRFRKPD